MEHPVGGAFQNSEEHLLEKVSVLEKRLERLLDYFRKKCTKKDKQIQHLEEEIASIQESADKEIQDLEEEIECMKEKERLRREEKKATRKPKGKGMPKRIRPESSGVGEDRDGGADVIVISDEDDPKNTRYIYFGSGIPSFF